MSWSRCTLACGLLALVAAGPVAAQPRLGALGGFTIAEFHGSGTEPADAPTGLMAGVFLSFPLGPAFRVQPELHYAFKGGDVLGVDGTVRLRYIEVPLLLRFVPGRGPIRPVLLAGPAIAIPVSCRIEASEAAGGGSFDCDDPRYDAELEILDTSGVAGAGLEIGSGGVALTIEFRAGLGLRSIDRSDDRGDVRTRAFTFHAGLSVPTGAGTR